MTDFDAMMTAGDDARRDEELAMSESTQIDPDAMVFAPEDEAALFLSYLERQRATFAWKTGGLDAAALRATLGPSSMTIGGMLKHLARFEDDMTHEWLLGQGQRSPWDSIDWEADQAWDWRTAADDSPESLYAEWNAAVERARAIIGQAIARGGLEVRARGVANEEGPLTLRNVMLNMIEEYARHNGHADLIRESIDGLVGQDPPHDR
ncbi:MAG: DinB family protein [Thermomicrobiales bacterium]